VGLEIIGLFAASVGASYGWWKLQQRRDRQLRLERPRFDADLEIAVTVAQHEARTRNHAHLWPLHLLHGLLQDEAFTAAIGRLGGDATAMETHVQDQLDRRRDPVDDEAGHEAAHVLGYAHWTAKSHDRPATCIDLWSRLSRAEVAKAACAAGRVDPLALLFLLVHGMPEPTTDLPDRVDVHVVIRNDDYTTKDFVVEILRDVFALAEADAGTRMEQTHDGGRAVVGRFKIAIARDKIAAARARARERSFPLWIGVEDC